MKSLAYTDIRKALETAISSNPTFKDWNYGASGISALLDALAYNDHRLGYFAKMLLDESFVDTAHTMPAMLSHAKRLGYGVRGKRAAVVSLDVVVTVPLSTVFASTAISVPRGTKFRGANTSKDTRVFTVLDPQEVVEAEVVGANRLFKGSILCHEGAVKTKTFITDGTTLNPIYDLRDAGCDSTTLQVFVAPPASTQEVQLKRAGKPEDIGGDDPVFYTAYDRIGTHKLFFAQSYAAGSTVRAEFLSSSGQSGNGAVKFAFAKGTAASTIDINGFTAVAATSDAPSQGGGEAQTIEDLRSAIPLSWRRQNRAVTSEDIQGIIQSDYADLSVVNVWGGEDEARRRYGKKMVCVVPKTTRVLSLGGRAEIRRILDVYRVPGDQIIFVDAVEQIVDVAVAVTRSASSRSDEQIANDVAAVVDAVLGTTSGTSTLAFSAYALATAVKAQVEGVAAAFPSITFASTVVFAPGQTSATLDYGVDLHTPVVTAPPAAVTTYPSTQSVVVAGRQGDVVTVTATPVVPEVSARRNVFFTVRSRKVKVVR